MITKIQKWGNSLGVRIPKGLARDVQVEEGVSVDVSVEGGRLLIAPLRKKRWDLRGLLRQITPETVHGEVDFGRPVGREIL